jgi:hypothetical protein
VGNTYQQGESRIEVGGVRKQTDIPSQCGVDKGKRMWRKEE